MEKRNSDQEYVQVGTKRHKYNEEIPIVYGGFTNSVNKYVVLYNDGDNIVDYGIAVDLDVFCDYNFN